ncbi:DUF2058 domain-containing protein [Alteromonas sp. ASW11-130]|uniref:DUF2058 domain-containing protein n=1 Tax=Alteromonas sp. ASW11-130 TaxID=3015775 RepID=UPI002241D87D|nr:DUF2058 domain-containing protein [Alteromonas sp. ASW11-130]MCW8091994.1 DUF2058 domain-containing protein [Alteromonas sp. ASW11-130]
MASLQDQLLKAGLADKSKAKQVRTEKRKKQKQKNKQKVEQVDEATVAARQAIEEKKAKDRALNEAQQQEREKRSIAAQVKQLISINIQKRGKDETVLNFPHDNVIKRMHVSNEIHKQVTKGKLVVVKFEDGYELIPTPVADKIAQRDEASIVYRADIQAATEETTSEEEDWYADYQIPDDLTW